MIKAEHISYKANGRNILDDISFQAEPGELLLILGSNGAGKSTLLKTLSGELKAAPGEIAINGKELSKWTGNELAKFRAVLNQQTMLTLPFMVSELVMMGRYPHFKNKPFPLDHTIVRLALKKTGIEHLADRNYLSLSGGEQQRVHLARVFAQVWADSDSSIRYLLMDEPVNSLDITHQHTTLRLAKEFATAGNCVISVLHDLNLAIQYADKILLLKNGTVLAFGKPSDILKDDIISATYDFPLNVCNHPSYTHPVIMPAFLNNQTTTYNGSDFTGLKNKI